MSSEAIRRLYAGKVIFHDGEAEVAEGVTVHCIGGHRPWPAMRAGADRGRVAGAGLGCGAFLRENLSARKPFPPSSSTFRTCWTASPRWSGWASSPALIIPGHDPLVRGVAFLPQAMADHIHRLGSRAGDGGRAMTTGSRAAHPIRTNE